MKNKLKALTEMKNRLNELQPVVSKGFKTDEELSNYKKENELLFNEYYNLYKQIEQMNWELMSPEQKERKLEVVNKIKAKSSDKND